MSRETDGPLPSPLNVVRTDLTERHTADSAFATMVATIADGMVVVNPQGLIQFVNPAAERLFGRSADELTGHELGLPVVAGETTELEILHPVHGAIIVELRVSATEWEGLPALLAAIRDVTERTRAQEREKELVREQTRRAAAEAGERRARFMGEAALQLGATLDYRAGLQSLADLAVPFIADWCIIDLLEPDTTFERAAVATASRHGATLLQRLRDHTPLTDPDSGTSRALRGAEPLLARDAYAPLVAGVLGLDADDRVFRDAGLGACMVLPLTARERRLGIITFCDAESGRTFDDDDLELAAEVATRAAAAVDNGRLYAQAQQASQARSDFLAVMSHELRTPLNAIIGYSDLLLMGIPASIPDESAEQVRRVRNSARHLLGLIEEILTFSRVEAGREELHIRTLRLNELAREVAAIAEPLAAARGLRFDVTLPEADIEIRSDPRKLRQILLNLLSNAIKFTDSGVVRLDIEHERDDVAIRVRDTGRGIRRADLDRIFEPFWQAEQSRTRRAEGTGLGLAVARRFTHLIAGDLTVDSRPGAGSTFTVRLPLRPPRPPPRD